MSSQMTLLISIQTIWDVIKHASYFKQNETKKDTCSIKKNLHFSNKFHITLSFAFFQGKNMLYIVNELQTYAMADSRWTIRRLFATTSMMLTFWICVTFRICIKMFFERLNAKYHYRYIYIYSKILFCRWVNWLEATSFYIKCWHPVMFIHSKCLFALYWKDPRSCDWGYFMC